MGNCGFKMSRGLAHDSVDPKGASRDRKLPGDRDDPGRKSWCQPIVSRVLDPAGRRDALLLMLRAGPVGRKGVVRAAGRSQTSAFKAQSGHCILRTGPCGGFQQREASAERWQGPTRPPLAPPAVPARGPSRPAPDWAREKMAENGGFSGMVQARVTVCMGKVRGHSGTSLW